MSIQKAIYDTLARLASSVNRLYEAKGEDIEAMLTVVNLRSDDRDQSFGPASLIVDNTTGNMTVLRYECFYQHPRPNIQVTRTDTESDLQHEVSEDFLMEEKDCSELAEEIVSETPLA